MTWVTTFNGKREFIVDEPCQPYNRPAAAAPVSIWTIVDRLDLEQLRHLVMGYSVHDPRHFEQQLMEMPK